LDQRIVHAVTEFAENVPIWPAHTLEVVGQSTLFHRGFSVTYVSHAFSSFLRNSSSVS